jgi:uncharacterized protein
MIYRFLTPKILASLQNSPVIILNGARQSGKSTLMKLLQGDGNVSRYETLDSINTISNLKNFTESTLRSYPIGTVIDEIQKLPEIFDTIKLVVDENRVPARFILTGSANVLLLPKLSESLAGRVNILTLSPLSIAEIKNGEAEPNNTAHNFIDTLFGENIIQRFDGITEANPNPSYFANLLVKGGYPEIQKINTLEGISLWFESYINTLIQRDIRDMASIDGLTKIPSILKILANQAGGILNSSDLARDIDINNVTFSRYMTLLESIFLVQRLQPWYRNIGKRLVKSPKVYLNDTGILSHLLNVDVDYILKDRQIFGKLLENMVFNELTKYISFSKSRPGIFYLRTQSGQEIDFVLENGRGEVVAVEVKSSTTVSRQDITNLVWLRDNHPGFHLGMVLYTGEQVLELSDRIIAVPISRLWNWV